MKLVAVTRVLNEDDIIEAFLRHHGGMFDHHLVLDNGSTDRTHEILRALRAEGLPLTIIQARSVAFCETDHNTFLFHYAVQTLGADWVCFLDADEFIDERASSLSLRGRLGALPEGAPVLKLRLVLYSDTVQDDPAELLVPRRIRHRYRERHEVYKVTVRRDMMGRGVRIDAGNHDVLFNGAPVLSETEEGLVLAHYPRRSAWQQISKSVMGRLKVLAAGTPEVSRSRSSHYLPLFETLRDDPAQLLLSEGFMGAHHGQPLPFADDPMPYLGSPLRYTERTDYRMKAVRALIAYTEALATQHGRLLDENSAVRLQAMQWGNTFSPLT